MPKPMTIHDINFRIRRLDELAMKLDAERDKMLTGYGPLYYGERRAYTNAIDLAARQLQYARNALVKVRERMEQNL